MLEWLIVESAFLFLLIYLRLFIRSADHHYVRYSVQEYYTLCSLTILSVHQRLLAINRKLLEKCGLFYNRPIWLDNVVQRKRKL